MGSLPDPAPQTTGNLPPDPTYASSHSLSSSYDVIVVGAGNAGLTLASRVSEDPEISVLLLEAGASNLGDASILVPAMAMQMQGDGRYDWGLETVVQPHFGSRQFKHHRGKGLGGSSALHLNMFVLPPKSSIDDWSALGNPGWTFSDLSPYLQKFHTLHKPSKDVANALHLDYLDSELGGSDGPIQASYGSYQGEYNKAWAATFDKLGMKARFDPSSGKHYGGLNAPSSVDPATGTRSYAVTGYFTDKVAARPNLRVLTEVVVEKVILEQSGAEQVARGVQFLDKSGKRWKIRSSQTVISAGVFGSPQILELSGIGNSSILRTAGIEPVVSLAGVGENFQDHCNVGVSFESAIPTMDSLRDPAILNAALADLQSAGTGMLSNCTYNAAYLPILTLPASELAKLASSLKAPYSFPAQEKQYALQRQTLLDPARSTVEYFLHPVQVPPLQCSRAALLSPEAKAKQYVTLFSVLSHPFSRGTVHVSTADPSSPPAIDPRYLSHPLDVEMQARHVQWLKTLVNQAPLRDLLVPGGATIPAVLDLEDVDGLRDLVRGGGTTYHPAGTCAMMPRDIGGVVDARLRVYGVHGLKVVDASVFPLVPRGNLQTVVYAVAERAAEWVKEDARR